MNNDFKKNSSFLYEKLFDSLKDYLSKQDVKKYGYKLLKNVVDSVYPLIVFKQESIKSFGNTLNNELTKKDVRFEINIYAVDASIDGVDYCADEIVNDITNEIVYFLEKKCKIKNVDTTTGLINFDKKQTQSERSVIRFSVYWLQEYNYVL